MAFLVFTIISTFLGQAHNANGKAVAPKLDKMSTIAVIISQYLTNVALAYHECFSR